MGNDVSEVAVNTADKYYNVRIRRYCSYAVGWHRAVIVETTGGLYFAIEGSTDKIFISDCQTWHDVLQEIAQEHKMNKGKTPKRKSHWKSSNCKIIDVINMLHTCKSKGTNTCWRVKDEVMRKMKKL